ncbi:putative membrane protein [Colwellia chukchiensis]|uniref:Putative membrane protein n=1 Tax=Colwellia chukchiensis TaxID=641665 RepID=A0A1H7GQ54_9GAMM|nr:TIGR01620 family protein [Colwellia chukchiensis]SEK39122.1 putative membrane protein [Colwellia chukchiensis]
MTDKNEKYQQQILFESLDGFDDSLAENTAQIIVKEQDWVSDEHVEPTPETEVLASKKTPWLWRLIALVFTLLVSLEAVQFFINGFSQSPLIASLYALLLAGLAIVCGRSLWRELSGLRQFKRQQHIQQQAQAFLNNSTHGDAVAFCEKLTQQLPCDLANFEQNSWQSLNFTEFNNAEIMQLYARNVLSQVDQKALKEVAKFSSESVVLVALSPIAIIDMLLMLWRNLRLVNKISALYGLKLGYWSRIKLIKQVIVNMAYAGASELVADLGADLLGAELLGKLSTRMAQGLGAGMLTARLGLKAMHLCRPIPFTDDAPKLGDIRAQIVSQVQGLIKK